MEGGGGGRLAEPKFGLKATLVADILYVTGGTYGSADQPEHLILSWDPVTESWQAAGDLVVGRYWHAALVIPASDVECKV